MTYDVFSGTLNPTHFTSPLLWPNGRPSQQLLSSCFISDVVPC